MRFNYILAKREGPKLKAQLTRAMKSAPATRYENVLAACRHAVKCWSIWGGFPDNWSSWQRALDDAAIEHSRMKGVTVVPPRLEELETPPAVSCSTSTHTRVRLSLPAEAAEKLVAITPEELSRILGLPVESVSLVRNDTDNQLKGQRRE